MSTLADLLHLLDATSDDRWRAGHPSTRPRESWEDRAHDIMRPDDPTAEAVADPARLRLAASWRSAMDHVRFLADFPLALRPYAIRTAEPITALHLADLTEAHEHWQGS
jgi:hypothetical protein